MSPGIDPRASAPASVPDGNDGRLSAPAALRNQAPITAALGRLLGGRSGVVLEIGSGTGQHAAAFAAAFPDLDWQPTDAIPEHLPSIRAWVETAGAANLRAPVLLDAASDWQVDGPFAAVLAINVIHIAPWEVAEAIVAGAGQHVVSGGFLLFYGPFREGGRHHAPSNAEFDASLRARNRDWGVRDIEAVATLATRAGFGPPEIIPLPANNRLIAFVRS